MSEFHFVASVEFVSDLIAMLRTRSATFVHSELEGSGGLIANPGFHQNDDNGFRVFVFDAPAASIKLDVDFVTTHDGRPKSFVKQRYGTPCIDFSFFNPRFDNGQTIAGHGELSMYAYHYDIDTNDRIEPSPGLFDLYKSAAEFIRARCRLARSSTTPKRFLVEKSLFRGDAGPWTDYRIPAAGSAH